MLCNIQILPSRPGVGEQSVLCHTRAILSPMVMVTTLQDCQGLFVLKCVQVLSGVI